MGRRDERIEVAFGQRVRQLREQRGISQERLAHDAGLDGTYVSGIERGVRNPAIRNVARIAQALRVPIAELFSDLSRP